MTHYFDDAIDWEKIDRERFHEVTDEEVADMLLLTDTQQDVLNFIIDRTRAGAQVTLRDIMHHFGWSLTNAVSGHLSALARKRRIVWLRDGRSGGIRLVGEKCPRCGGCGVLVD